MNPHPLEQEAINRAVLEACENFHGILEPSVYKDYVLTMLFLKNVSDVWQDHLDAYLKSFGDNPELIEELMQAEAFILPSEASFYSLYAKRHQVGNGERIDRALQLLADSNIAKLRDVFQEISFNSTRLGDEAQKNDVLRRLLEDFAKGNLNLRPSRLASPDVVGNAFEFLIKNVACASGKKFGDFYTPPEIAQLMAQLLAPQSGDKICDPACGTGSLLMHCGQATRQQNQSREYELYGQELLGSTWALAKMNMYLHQENNHRVEWGDSLRTPKLLDAHGQLLKFDIVVANPPFSLEKWGHDELIEDPFQRFQRGMPPRTKGDYAFISHMLASLQEQRGRMAVIVPNGVLFRGAAERQIRRQLIEENLLDAVIGLPEKLFYGTGISAALLICRRNKSDDKVLFIDASRDFQDGKNQNHLRPQDIEKVCQAYQRRVTQPGYSFLASVEDLLVNDANLNISRYVHSDVPQADVDFLSLRGEREEIKKQLAALELEMDEHLLRLGLIPDYPLGAPPVLFAR